MAATSQRPWRVGHDGLVLRVRVTPKSSRDQVDGVVETAEGPAIQVRVRAVPEDGAANAAVVAVVAKWLGLAKRSVTVSTGAKSRIKGVSIAGEAGALAAILAARLAGLAHEKDD